jgi:hypothetical protein
MTVPPCKCLYSIEDQPILASRSYSWYMSRDSVVGIAIGYGLDDRGVGVRVPVCSRIFSCPSRSDRLWGPPNLLSNGHLGFSLRVKAAGTFSSPLTCN